MKLSLEALRRRFSAGGSGKEDLETAAELAPTLTRSAFADDGVTVEPTPVTFGDTVKVRYEGLLARSGADRVYLHCGYGPSWRQLKDIEMARVGDTVFETTVEARTPDGPLNFCFHDSAQNWDSNNGKNWSFTIHDGESPQTL